MREGIILRCDNCKNENYLAKRDKKKQTEKLNVKKFCSNCRTHKEHKEKK